MEALVWVRPRRTTDERRPQPGDVVAIRPDGWEWGRLEGPPDFAVVPIPDLTEAEQSELLSAERQLVASDPIDGEVYRKVRARRARLDFDRLTPQQRDKVRSGRLGRRLSRSRLAQAVRLKADDSRVI